MMRMMTQQEEESGGGGGGSEYGGEAGAATAAGGADGAAAIAAATALEQETLPPNWYVYTDSRGVFYYHNPQLNVTQWERPPGASVSSSSGVDAGAAAAAGVGEEACTLDLSFSGEAAAAAGRDSSSSTRGGGGRAAAGRGEKAGAVDRSVGARKTADGFLSLAASPADVRQTLQQQEASAAGRLYCARLASDSTVATSRLQQQEYSGLAAGGEGEVGSAAAAGDKQQRGGPEDLFWLLRCCGCLDFYTALQRLFAVTTDDICSRLRLALLPCRRHGGGAGESSSSRSSNSSSQEGGGPAAAELLTRPDMYGPFWVATTLVILAFACSNFPLLLSPSAAAAAGAAADVRRLGQAAAAVYGCFVLPPLVVWLALLYFASQRGAAAGDGLPEAAARGQREEAFEKKAAPALEQLLCVQGYAFVPLCVCSSSLLLLQVLPVHIAAKIQWAVTVAAGLVAVTFLVQQLKQLLRSHPLHVKVPCCLLLVGAALLLLVLLMHFAAVGQQQAAAGKALQPRPGAAAAADTGGDSGLPPAPGPAAAAAAADSSSSEAGGASSSAAEEQQQGKTGNALPQQQQQQQLAEAKEEDNILSKREAASLLQREAANDAEKHLAGSAYEEQLQPEANPALSMRLPARDSGRSGEGEGD